MMKRFKNLLNRLLPKTPAEGSDWFIHAVTVTISVWLMVRGGVIVVFRDYYGSSPGFLLLNAFPYAPESWGWLLLAIGGLSLASVLYAQKTLLRFCSLAASVCCFIIGAIVAATFYGGTIESAYIATSWFGLGAVFFVRYAASLRWEL